MNAYPCCRGLGGHEDWCTPDYRRSRHTCIRDSSSMHCRGCATGVPYQSPTLDEVAPMTEEDAWRAVWADQKGKR